MTTLAAATLAVATMTVDANASTFSFVGEFSGNGCTGNSPNATFPDNFVQGPISVNKDGEVCMYEDSPSILKYNFGNDGNVSGTEVNSQFTFDTSWITINYGSDNKSGTWEYDPTNGDAVGITAAYFKGGDSYFVYLWNGATPYFGGDGSTFAWSTGDAGLSNAVFFDSMSAIPLPAAGWLLLAGLGGLAAYGRKKRAA